MTITAYFPSEHQLYIRKMQVLICGLSTVLSYRFEHGKASWSGGGAGCRNGERVGGRDRAFKFTFLG